MKKILLAAMCTLIISALSGCNDIKEVSNKNVNSSTSEKSADLENETDSTSQKENKLSDEALSKLTVDTDKTHLFDLCKALTDKENEMINTYALHISDTYHLNASVLITDNLEDSEPSEYAENCYKELFKNTPGFLLLVNNETGNDYIYRNGYTSLFITDDEIQLIFAEISPLLVTDKTYDGIKTAFDSVSTLLPQHAIDRSGTLSKEEINEIESIISDSESDDEQLTIIFVSDIEKDDLADYAANAHKGIIEYSENGPQEGVLLAVNVKTGDSAVSGSGKYENLSTANMDDTFSAFLDKTSENNSYDAKGAAEAFTSMLKGN